MEEGGCAAHEVGGSGWWEVVIDYHTFFLNGALEKNYNDI